MHEKIINAIRRTFGFNAWEFENEFEIKHELFHQLAAGESDGTLIAQVQGTPSCRLHAEGKVLNGNPQKADLLICDPERRQKFNYNVDHIIELKNSMSDRIVRDELEKLHSYGKTFKGFFLVANRVTHITDLPSIINGQPVYVLHRQAIAPILTTKVMHPSRGDFDTTLIEVRKSLDETLLDYGRGKQQYHSFFWCNYEHEIGRGHSFPSEGDFNAHFYHRLRTRLPAGIMIRSEVHPQSAPTRRIDFVISNTENTWAIPIEIKMNWDQFKPKYKNYIAQTPEAKVIIDRLDDIRRSYAKAWPMVVVIQGAWQSSSDVRSQAMPILESVPFPMEFVSFNEHKEGIERRLLGAGEGR
jgi:hypothetical protein